MNNTTVVGAPAVAPPLFGGFGFGGFGFPFGGVSIMPTFAVPIPFFGGLLQFFFLTTLLAVVFGVVRAIASNAGNKNKNDKDGWGDM